ncbi:SDR family oxidoreductase [Mycobacterium sp. AZCC_0083]|uniref:SDR family oxidoreductase n=1 Tax=Mycobacterium sp. AZCC_0083 TaxID=2735882 RepID=UPI0016150517|nr:SDR family NAD(P)-dependent oxidoreductase [Mycobacterium sp. AZCC_0083]MBB5165862.1 NAD(P)-dependent dehydrogenase (short-subunit alcohol dehydrogenase family) [Mycobacterium sp. AZCC_0083]
MQIEGTVAVVTGAGSGIGRALAVALAAAGASVVAGDIDDAGVQQTAGQILSTGAAALGVRADASSTDGVAALIASARDEFGPVDVYVANAGIIGPPGLGDDEREWDRIFDVNVRGHVRAAKALVPEWLDRGRGHFVTVASAAGLLTQIGAAGYAVTKHAAVGFAEWLSITYGDNGIGVTCVCPMGVDTPLLKNISASADPAIRVGAAAVVNAGEVVSPDRVAEMTVEAVREDRFLVLPHPAVLDMYRHKGGDYERWIAGMRRYQKTLG